MNETVRVIIKKLTRETVVRANFFRPQAERQALERRLRGREEFHKLREADCVVVSFGKSGRTWLRVMLSRYYQLRYRLSQRHLIGFANLHDKNRAIPKILFTHDNYLRDYTGNRDSKADFRDRKVVLLVRNPGDVAVSQYFQWRYRMLPAKKSLNAYPAHGADVSIFDFVYRHDAGLKKAVNFLNDWTRALPDIPDHLVVRYEDMRAQPEAGLRRILTHIGADPTDEELRQSVAFASVENMRKLEEGRVFWLSGGRMVAKDKSNPDSHKVRRAKVGGYRDYFDDEQVRQIDAFVERHLLPGFGYGERPAMRGSRAASA
jgi:hypothetical protein